MVGVSVAGDGSVLTGFSSNRFDIWKDDLLESLAVGVVGGNGDFSGALAAASVMGTGLISCFSASNSCLDFLINTLSRISILRLGGIPDETPSATSWPTEEIDGPMSMFLSSRIGVTGSILAGPGFSGDF